MSSNSGFRFLGARKPKRVTINSSATSYDPVEAVLDPELRAICVIALSITADATGTIIVNSDVTEVGRKEFTAAGEWNLGHNPDGWFETVAGQKLNINNASGLVLTGVLVYVEI